ncbi:MAG: hypothetical protein ACLGIN_17285 [Candidatus Sericytochromatia bacterium]
MQIQYRIVYYTVYVPGASRGPRSSVMDDIRKKCQEAGAQGASKAKLEQIQEALGAIQRKLMLLPNANFRNQILAELEVAKAAMQSGNVDEAANIVASALEKCNRLAEAGDRIRGALQAAQAQASRLPSPAKGAMLSVIRHAEDAVGRASSEGELSEVADLVMEAVQHGKTAENTAAGSPEAVHAASKLQEIAAKLAAVGREQTAGMVQDMLTANGFGGGTPAEGVRQLKNKTRDAFKLQKLDALERLMEELPFMLAGMPGEGMQAVAMAEMRQILGVAAQDPGQALDMAQALKGRLDQAGKFRTVLQAKAERGEAMLGRMQGPAKEAFAEVLGAIGLAVDGAESTESLLGLDGQFMRALRLAEQAGADTPEGRRALLALRGMARSLRPPDSPGDTLTLSPGAGTQPLGPRQPGTSPLGPRPLPPRAPGGPVPPSPGAHAPEPDLESITVPSPGAHEQKDL